MPGAPVVSGAGVILTGRTESCSEGTRGHVSGE